MCHTPRISRSTTLTRVRAVSEYRTALSPTCTKELAIKASRVRADRPHGEICITAEATRGHCACVLALLSLDAGRLWSCVWHLSLLRQLGWREREREGGGRRGGTQAAFDRKTSHYRREISDLQWIVRRSLVWTADGPPHPAVTRTLQYAADIASCGNEQHMSAQALQHRWKHEIQIALQQ